MRREAAAAPPRSRKPPTRWLATTARNDRRRCTLAPAHRGEHAAFAERLQWFWANHFTVSLAKGARAAPGLRARRDPAAHRRPLRGSAVGRHHAPGDAALPRQPAIRRAASARRGADRARARRDDETPRITGLNENLAREVLELGTRSAPSGRGPDDGGYTQADVTAFAAVLTGWRIAARSDAATRLRRRLARAGQDRARPQLWRRPAGAAPCSPTWRATPDGALVATAGAPPSPTSRRRAGRSPRGATCRSDGQFAELYRELIASPEAWAEPRSAGRRRRSSSSRGGVLARPCRSWRGACRRCWWPVRSRASARRPRPPPPAGRSRRRLAGPEALWKRLEWARAWATGSARASTRASSPHRLPGPAPGRGDAPADRARRRWCPGPRALADGA